jgi:hypothetical protein
MEKNKNKLIEAIHLLPKEKKCLLMLFLTIFALIGNLDAQTPQIWPTEISFNYDANSNTYDALNIQKNASTSISVPEYVKDLRNENCAYIMSQNSRKIKVKFNSNNSNINYLVKATVISGTGIGNICETFVAPCDLNSKVFTIELSGSIPNNVGKRTFTWKWEATALPINSPYCPITCTSVNTTHTFYTLLATPQAPMSTPWTDVLDYACVWASGESSFSNATTKITESLYVSGFDYETSAGASRYGGWTVFNLTQFLSELGNSYDVNCLDMGKAVTTFANSIGCNIFLTTFSGGFALNCIDPIGLPSPTNNTFSSPLIDDDCRDGGFGYHAFSQNINKATWDATLKYDIDENPDNVSNSNPGCGNTSTGYSWKLPCNESEATYIQRLVDDWTSWENCSNPYNCGYFTYNREFSTN